jgi:acyl-CoA dehydrogenase
VDFDLTSEQTLLRDSVREFVARECPRDLVRACDRERRFPQEIYTKLAGLGVLGIALDAEDGGVGGTLEQALVTEELARGSVAVAVAFVNAACLGQAVLSTHPAAAVPNLPAEIAAGRSIVTFAWTEPDAGSDILALRTRATPAASGGYVVNGAKTFITLAEEASHLLTVVRTRAPEGRRSDGLTCLLVPSTAEGVEIRPLGKVGQRSAPFYDVAFADLELPPGHLVGEEHGAWGELLPLLASERTLFAAVCLGIARQALAEATSYCLEREAFGRTIAHLQAVQHHLAEMKTSVDATELLVYRSAWLADRDRLQGDETSQALMVAARTASMVTDLGLQVTGAAGYSEEFDMERHWRDARAFRLSPVSTEVALNLVARGLGLPRSY